MRAAAIALLLATVAAAEPPAGPEPDAAVAAAARWVGPGGCASGSYRSRALPVVTEVEEAWRLDFDAVEAPPVHWDGTGYVVARIDGKPCLVAFDLSTGRELAREKLRGFVKESGLLVWDHLVLVQPEEKQLSGYRLKGRRLGIDWVLRGRSGLGPPRLPVVHDNEVYCYFGESLARIRPGSSMPTWTASVGEHVGRPAVHGPFVYVASFGDPWPAEIPGRAGTVLVSDLYLQVFRRSDGELIFRDKVCQSFYAEDHEPAPEVTVAGGTVFVGSQWPFLAADGKATHVIIPLRRSSGPMGIDGRPGLWTCEVPPAHHPRLGTLLLSSGRNSLYREWSTSREGRIYSIAREAEQPDCFRDRVTPTVLGDVVYFGSWAADLRTREIFWRLPVKHVTYPAVPADRLVLVVDEGRALRAFRGRGAR